MKKKRPRLDSVHEQVRVMAAANKEINPPGHMALTADEKIHFDSIIKEMAKADWTDHQIELVTMLARTMNEVNIQQSKMTGEGALIKGKDGKPMVSPRLKIINACYDRIVTLRRSLSIHARAQGTNIENIGRRNALAKAIENASLFSEDDLIARPLN